MMQLQCDFDRIRYRVPAPASSQLRRPVCLQGVRHEARRRLAVLVERVYKSAFLRRCRFVYCGRTQGHATAGFFVPICPQVSCRQEPGQCASYDKKSVRKECGCAFLKQHGVSNGTETSSCLMHTYQRASAHTDASKIARDQPLLWDVAGHPQWQFQARPLIWRS